MGRGRRRDRQWIFATKSEAPNADCSWLVAKGHPAKLRSHGTTLDNVREFSDRLLPHDIAVKHHNPLGFFGQHSFKPARRWAIE
jgi:hypothetical protein